MTVAVRLGVAYCSGLRHTPGFLAHGSKALWSCGLSMKYQPLLTTVFFISTLPETNIAPENGWLEYIGILLSYWGGLFSGATLVSGRVCAKGVRSWYCWDLRFQRLDSICHHLVIICAAISARQQTWILNHHRRRTSCSPFSSSLCSPVVLKTLLPLVLWRSVAWHAIQGFTWPCNKTCKTRYITRWELMGWWTHIRY